MSIFESKEFKKASKLIGEKLAKEFLSKTEEELKNIIAMNSLYIHETKIETQTNSKYIEASETKKLFDTSLNETIRPLQAAINLSAAIMKQHKEEAKLKKALEKK